MPLRSLNRDVGRPVLWLIRRGVERVDTLLEGACVLEEGAVGEVLCVFLDDVSVDGEFDYPTLEFCRP